MEKAKSLAILIPSFNQPNGALATVRELARVRSNFRYRLEVVLSDNCSDDSSYLKVLDPFVDEGWLTIHRQRFNLGFSGNVRFLAHNHYSDLAVVVGCGDIPNILGIGAVLQEIARQGITPGIICALVQAHSSESTGDISFPDVEVDFRKYSPLLSAWVPYQEAIPGQLFSSEVLRENWPANSLTGNTWPHIECALNASKSSDITIFRSNVAIVSMHQDQKAWYWSPGANTRAIAAHLSVLLRLGLWRTSTVFKVASLLLFGLPNALKQDYLAAQLKGDSVNRAQDGLQS